MKGPFLQEILESYPTLSVLFAAAGFRFDCSRGCGTNGSVAAFRFTSESKTRRMIQILSGPVFVGSFAVVDG